MRFLRLSSCCISSCIRSSVISTFVLPFPPPSHYYACAYPRDNLPPLSQEYHKNPSSIGGRKYTPFAEWKFREFNELPHHFARRLDESYPTASMYIGQFPNEKLTIIMRFIAFIAGSFAAVLLLATVIDPDLFVGFEVTPHRSVLFFVGVFGSILAVARGMIPEENRVFDPELLIMEVIQDTHYMPDHWKDQLHSKKVRRSFTISSITLTAFLGINCRYTRNLANCLQ